MLEITQSNLRSPQKSDFEIGSSIEESWLNGYSFARYCRYFRMFTDYHFTTGRGKAGCHHVVVTGVADRKRRQISSFACVLVDNEWLIDERTRRLSRERDLLPGELEAKQMFASFVICIVAEGEQPALSLARHRGTAVPSDNHWREALSMCSQRVQKMVQSTNSPKVFLESALPFLNASRVVSPSFRMHENDLDRIEVLLTFSTSDKYDSWIALLLKTPSGWKCEFDVPSSPQQVAGEEGTVFQSRCFVFRGGDGSTTATAVVVDGWSNSFDIVLAESEWARRSHPDWVRQGHMPFQDKQKHTYDRVEYKTPSGDTKRILFDITFVNGKW